MKHFQQICLDAHFGKLLNIHKQRRRKDKKTYWEIDFSIEIKENFFKKLRRKPRCWTVSGFDFKHEKMKLGKVQERVYFILKYCRFFHTSDSNYLEEYSGN